MSKQCPFHSFTSLDRLEALLDRPRVVVAGSVAVVVVLMLTCAAIFSDWRDDAKNNAMLLSRLAAQTERCTITRNAALARAPRDVAFRSSSYESARNAIVPIRCLSRPFADDSSLQQDPYEAWTASASRSFVFVAIFGAVFVGFGCHCASLIARRNRAMAALQQLASVDGLTRLNNRRTFDSQIVAEWRRATRSRQPLSVLFIDIDHFKAYNDTYGHPAGDAALVAVARCIEGSLRRAGDFAARYGGEEFVVVLPNTDEAGAQSVAETLRRAVGELETGCRGDGSRRVTVSIGVATWAARMTRDIHSIVNAADLALYRAKSAGRNTVSALQLA